MEKIKIGIIGYGNLGRGVELSLKQNPDMELQAVFSRRNPDSLKILTETAAVCSIDEVEAWRGKIDVMILCGGSSSDLPMQSPQYATLFPIVDSFDTHANIPAHFAACDAAAKANGTLALISAGWDPGLFSLNRLYGSCVLPDGRDYTFWGKGVSQGHSDAIRRIPGVLDAKQYTVPVQEALTAVRSGSQPELSTRQKHTRECFVVAAADADQSVIETAIKTMPNYFADYDTTVTFITAEEMAKNHDGIPHGGCVMRSGNTGMQGENSHLIEYSLKLDSNPEFTSSILVCFARAVYRLSAEGQTGAKTVLDIPPAYLSPKSGAELRASLL
ncbi:MAG: diaminopimelate dehydrogenase [Oscillospiraceae bacterium]